MRQFLKDGIIVRTIVNNLTFDGTSKDTMKQCMNDALLSVLAAIVRGGAIVGHGAAAFCGCVAGLS
jgi:putative DNA-invertase from lambdoid prophage Rac